MEIFFLILKIIGILLLIILSLAVILIFHPIFYKIEGKFEDETSLKARLWWLFHIIRVDVLQKNSKTDVTLRIFGIPKRQKEKQANKADVTEGKAGEEAVLEESVLKETEEIGQDIAREEISVAEERIEKEPAKKRKTNKKKEKEKFSFFSFFSDLKKEILDEKNHMAASALWQEVMYLLLHVKPKYLKAEITFSTGDPATTGMITGLLSLFPIIYKHDAHIYPDFLADDFFVRGNLKAKGHMALAHILCSFIRIIKDKNIRRLYYKLKK